MEKQYTTITKAYCEPKNTSDRKRFDYPPNLDNWEDEAAGKYIEECYFVDDGSKILVSTDKPVSGKKLVSVDEFDDLYHDRITDWRLKELGFEYYSGVNGFLKTIKGGHIWYKKGVAFQLCINGVDLDINLDKFEEFMIFYKALKGEAA